MAITSGSFIREFSSNKSFIVGKLSFTLRQPLSEAADYYGSQINSKCEHEERYSEREPAQIVPDYPTTVRGLIGRMLVFRLTKSPAAKPGERLYGAFKGIGGIRAAYAALLRLG